MKLRVLALHDVILVGVALATIGAVAQSRRGQWDRASQLTVPRRPEPKPTSRPEVRPILATVDALLAEQRQAIERGDLAAMVATVAPGAVGFGVDADEFVEGRAAIETQLRHDLEWKPRSAVNLSFSHVGRDNEHAWIAMELELSGRRYAITQLAAMVKDSWSVVAWHWAIIVPDRAVIAASRAGTKPLNAPIVDRLDGPKPLGDAVKIALGSSAAYAATVSSREDGFNFGSAPGERIIRGAAVKSWWSKLRARIKTNEGVRVIGGGAWDPTQASDPRIGVALTNTTLTIARDTLTFRVMTVFLKETDERWKIVLSHWSHGGPIPDVAVADRANISTTKPAPLAPDKPEVKPDVVPAPDAGAETLKEAQDEYAGGNFREAEIKAEQAMARGSREAAAIVAMAACKLGKLDKAVALSKRLRGAELTRFKAACPSDQLPTNAGSGTAPTLGPPPPTEDGGLP